MGDEIQEYEGDIPDGILDGVIGFDDFYTPEQVQDFLLNLFPDKNGTPFSGLDYVCVIGPEMDIDEARELTRRTDAFRGVVAAKLIPEFDGTNAGLRLRITESQKYREKGEDNPWEQHAMRLELTNLGYILESSFVDFFYRDPTEGLDADE